MSHSSYTSSERKGIIAIALAALLIIASGIVLSLCGRPREKIEEIPVVVEHAEMVDSAGLKKSKETKPANKSKKKSTTKTKTTKSTKTYRKRSPLDEPV